MRTLLATRSSVLRRPTTGLCALLAATCILSACVPIPTDATATAHAGHLIPAAYYLRTVDGRPVPVVVSGGLTLSNAYVVADTTSPDVIGWGEGVSRGTTTSSRMGLGTARVLSQSPNGTSVAVISWGTNTAVLDTVRWTPDSVIFARTATQGFAVGAGRRLVYTRMVSADTL